MITIENVQYKLDKELVDVETLSDGQLQEAIQSQSEKIEVMSKQEKDMRVKVLDMRNALLQLELDYQRKKNAIQHNKLIKSRLESERDVRVMLDEEKEEKNHHN